MPKENTHLFAAHQLLSQLKNQKIKSLLSQNLNHYYLGSIIPDTFFYSPRKKIAQISRSLHRSSGTRLLSFLKLLAPQSRHPSDLAFLFGCLTHYALDTTFHPLINCLSGNYYHSQTPERKQAQYLHHHLETYLDKKYNSSFFIDEYIPSSALKNTAFLDFASHRWHIPQYQLLLTLKTQLFLNRLFRKSFFIFPFFCFLVKLRILHPRFLALFYAHLKKDIPHLKPKTLHQFTPLLPRSLKLAEKMIISFYSPQKSYRK